MKVLLIEPPINSNVIAAGLVVLNEPLALEIIAATIPNHEVKILDMRLDSHLMEELNSFQPDVVATTSYTAGVYTANQILQQVKKYNPKILTVIGGHHATMVPEDFNKEFVDVIIIGEGEVTFKELIDTYESRGNIKNIKGLALPQNGNLYFTPSRELLSSLDQMPIPNRDLTKKYRHEYFRGSWSPSASMVISRGCPFRCDFCAMWKITHGKYRIRTPESVVNELMQIDEEYIDVVDDNTLHNVKKAEEIYQLIKERGIKKKYKLYARSDTIVKRPDIIEKWREIGLELLLVGVESFRDEELKARNKLNLACHNEEAIRILHKNGVEMIAYFLIDPDYTEDDFNALAEYVKKMELAHPVFTVLTPFPGTDLYEKRYHEFITYNYELFDFFHPILPTKLPIEKFCQCLAELYRKVYSSKESQKFFSSEMVKKFYLSIMNAHEAYNY